MRYKWINTFLLALACYGSGAQTKTNPAVLKGFMDMRFGMFVHWGPVSLRGTEIGWSRGNQVPVDDYDSLYKEFDPVLFNADAWVRTAREAGMKYLTITARHHDGFCLWPTKFTDYNIANTPYKKDVLKALKEACKKQGIRFCIYYSVLDWHHPDYPIHGPSKGKEIDPKSDMNRYVVFLKNQLKELIDNYDPYMLWFDGQWESPWTDERGKDLYAYLKQIKPDVIINNRLGKEFAATDNRSIDASKMVGDYDTPEQAVGKLNMQTPWESCFTLCRQWAWKPNDNMKSLKECLAFLSKSAGGNGNLLLNVGPMPDGRIEARQSNLLKGMGDWLRINGEAVYGTLGGPYEPNDTYACTRKGSRIFVHVLNTDTAAISLKNIPGRTITRATTMQGAPVTIQNGAEAFTITRPPGVQGKAAYILILELDGDAENLAIIK